MNASQTGQFCYGKSDVVVCRDEYDVGRRAASAVAGTMRRLLAEQREIRVALAAGESQITFLDALAQETAIAWDRVICFSIDDFHDPRIPDHYTCGYQVERQLWSRVKPRQVHRIAANAANAGEEARRFDQVVRAAAPMDILCQGIGTSGHLALNEPFDADFNDSAWVRVVNIAEQSKRQLRDDPNFKALGYIPAHGISMTIPAILASRHIFTIVPLALKRPVLTRIFALTEPTPELPASILSQVSGTIFVDRHSCPAALLGAVDTGARPVTT